MQYEPDELDLLSDESDILESDQDSTSSFSDADLDSGAYSGMGEESDFMETAGFDSAGIDADAMAVPPIDFTAFQSLPFEDMNSNAVMLACLGGGLLVCLIGAGFSLKTASRMTGGHWVSVRRASTTALFSFVAFIASVFALTEFAKDVSPVQALLAAVAVGVVVIALRFRQNPVRAVFTSLIAAGLLGGFVGLLAAGAGMALPELASKDQLAVVANHVQPFVNSVAARAWPGDEAANHEKLSLNALLVPLGNDGTKTPKKYTATKERGVHANPFID